MTEPPLEAEKKWRWTTPLQRQWEKRWDSHDIGELGSNTLDHRKSNNDLSSWSRGKCRYKYYTYSHVRCNMYHRVCI